MAVDSSCRIMPYCSACGAEVGQDHHFCGSCANPLPNCPDELRDSHDDSSTDGFLSGAEYQYLMDVQKGDRKPHRDDPERQAIIDRARAALLDFRLLSQLETIDDCDVFGKPVASLVRYVDGDEVSTMDQWQAFGLLDLVPMLVKSLTPTIAAGLIQSTIQSGISVPDDGELDVSVSIEITPDDPTLAALRDRWDADGDLAYFESWLLYQEGILDAPEL